jgi:uncharacterized protein (TIGR02996 family)
MSSAPNGAGAAEAEASSRSLYRALAWAGGGLYALCALAGIAYSVLTQGRPPLPSAHALTEAERRLGRGDLAGAARQFRMAAHLDGSDYDTPRRLASLLDAAGDPSGRVDHHERFRDLNPGSPLAHRQLGWTYYENRRPAEAEAAFLRALSLDPRDLDARVGYANALLDQGQPARAEAALRPALALGGNQAAVRNLLGIALAQQGRRDEALLALEEAVRLDPSPTFVQNLESLRQAAPPAAPVE